MGWFCPFVCVSFPVGQPDPNAIANANPDPPTSDREVPIHGWRLAVAPCGLVMCACRTRAELGFGVCCALGFEGAISLLSWFCFAAEFSICSLLFRHIYADLFINDTYRWYFQHAHFIPRVKRETHINWPMMTCQDHTHRLKLP